MLEASGIAVVAADADGAIEYVNAAAEALLGIGAPSWQSRSIGELLGFDATVLETMLATIRSGGVVDSRLVSYAGDASHLPLLLGNYPVFRDSECGGALWTLRPLSADAGLDPGDPGRLVRYRALFELASVPQLVLAVAGLCELAIRYRLHSRAAVDTFVETRPALLDEVRERIEVIELNRAAAGLVGTNDAIQLTTQLRRSMRREDLMQALYLGVAIQQGKDRTEYALDYRHDKTPRSLLAVASLPDRDRLGLGALLTLLDLTDLREAEADLHAREQFLSATLKAVPDLLIVYDYEQSQPMFINEAVSRELGFGWDDMAAAGRDFVGRCFHPDDRVGESGFADVRRRLASGEIVEQSVRLRHSSGQWRQYFLRTAALEVGGDRARVGVMLARDVSEQLHALERLDEQEHRYRLLAENFTDIVCTIDTDLRLTYVSPSVAWVTGYEPAEVFQREAGFNREQGSLKTLVRELEADLAAATPHRRGGENGRADAPRVRQVTVAHKNGHAVHLEVQASLMRDKAGALRGMMLVCRDVTQRVALDGDLRLAAKVFENSLEAIFITDSRGMISQVNHAFTEITGFAEDEVLGESSAVLAVAEHAVSFRDAIQPILERTGFWQGELWCRRRNGGSFPAATGITSVVGKEGEFLGYITSFRDITERKSTEERIRKLAYFDPLTGLPNRSLFIDRLNQELQRSLRNNSHVVLLFLDLDRFKAVNDSMGHAAGDQLLGKVAEKLANCVRGHDSVARMGGDEFTIILGDLHERSQAVAAAVSVARKVMDVLGHPTTLHGREVFLAASIGIAIYPQDGEDAATLLKHADVAMYHAKKAGKNNFQFYVEAMNARALERLELQNGLYRAAVNEDLQVLFQPITDLASGRIIAVETLLRWQHPSRGTIHPTEFVPVAEESGLIVRIGEWVLAEACRQMARWQAQGLGLDWIAVNISARQFAEGDLVRHVINALDDSGLEAKYLELELTESILMDDIDYTLGMLKDLKAMGVDLAIDDFGTGYSSLNYLKQFPIDRLKIDRSFVQLLPHDVEDVRITEAILAIARGFDLSVVAEGVERAEQAQLLGELGCHCAQGFLYGRAMSGDAIAQLLLQQQPALVEHGGS